MEGLNLSGVTQKYVVESPSATLGSAVLLELIHLSKVVSGRTIIFVFISA